MRQACAGGTAAAAPEARSSPPATRPVPSVRTGWPRGSYLITADKSALYTARKANKKRNIMPLAARAELESLLRARKLDVTLTSAALWADPDRSRDIAPTGMAALDAALGGGLARGHLSEIVGPRS